MMTEYQSGSPDQPGGSLPADGSRRDERTWAMMCHLSALVGYVFPFGNIIGPLVVWLMKREEFALVDDQGKESLNFQITMMIAFAVSCLLILVIIGIFLLSALAILNVVLIVVATIKANDGQYFRYPLCIRFIK